VARLGLGAPLGQQILKNVIVFFSCALTADILLGVKINVSQRFSHCHLAGPHVKTEVKPG
jgi:hypothetical protein